MQWQREEQNDVGTHPPSSPSFKMSHFILFSLKMSHFLISSNTWVFQSNEKYLVSYGFICACISFSSATVMHFLYARHCEKTKNEEDEVLLTSVFVCVCVKPLDTADDDWGRPQLSAHRTEWWGNQVILGIEVRTETLNKSRIFNSWDAEEGGDRKRISEKRTPWRKHRDRGLECWCGPPHCG